MYLKLYEHFNFIIPAGICYKSSFAGWQCKSGNCEMKWNEMKWNEMKWNEMKRNNEMKWNEKK